MNYSRFPMNLAAAGVTAVLLSTGAMAQPSPDSKTITEADCTSAKLGDSIPASAIGEPVPAVTLSAPSWNPAAKGCLRVGAASTVPWRR